MAKRKSLSRVIEPESEMHRTKRALTHLNSKVVLPFESGRVRIVADERVAAARGGQLLLTLLVNLLSRMKGIVRLIELQVESHTEVLPGVPLRQGVLVERLAELVASLSGPESEFGCSLRRIRKGQGRGHVVIGVGTDQGHVRLGSDAWRALLGSFATEARWNETCPVGPYMAATLGAMEVLKLLFAKNYGTSQSEMIQDLAFSVWNLGLDVRAKDGPDLDILHLSDIAVAGVGAGGTATLYVLSSFGGLKGHLGLVDAGSLKLSSLGRYLMTDYSQVHDGMHKLSSVREFMSAHAPGLTLDPKDRWWHEGRNKWSRVVSTVDTVEARHDIQRCEPRVILDAGVLLGSIYSVLRVADGGWCLECKHPYDPLSTVKRRAVMWGLSVPEVQRRTAARSPVTAEDLERLAQVQNRSVEDFTDLKGLPFDEVPALTECGETPLALDLPSQAPVLPMATTAAGIVVAAEVIKELLGYETRLNNYWTHDLRHRPRSTGLRFKPTSPQCSRCQALRRTPVFAAKT